MTAKPEKMGIDDIVGAVMNSDHPFESAMEVIIGMMALAGVIADEEAVFARLEHIISEARQLNNERHS